MYILQWGNDVIEKLFKSVRSKYQNGSQTSMKECDFIFDSVQLMYCKCHKVNFKLDGSYIDSPESMKKKKATINTKNEDGKCFHYTTTVALSYEKPFINKYN